MMSNNGNSVRTRRNEYLEEEDVWGFVRKREVTSPKQRKYHSSSSSSSWEKPFTSAPKLIPKANNHPNDHATKMVVHQSSAPMNIPDWSKIYGKDSTKKSSKIGSWGDSDVDDNDKEMVPPHEWIARKLARSQITSFSVCEGLGRTLKGRDLSKVRNAILTKTGFLEQ